jgi:hypothetical protein
MATSDTVLIFQILMTNRKNERPVISYLISELLYDYTTETKCQNRILSLKNHSILKNETMLHANKRFQTAILITGAYTSPLGPVRRQTIV